ncbi:MAG: hypothetical protein DMG22_13145 [Acidobacteria bacterium]|nr:MAG: hypothetical protein DMG22_13145 [Acidobacteriota bacterium]
MLVLFDQGTPKPLGAYLKGHTVKTAREQGWSALSNGELLSAAEAAGFEVLVTTDKQLPFQQNLDKRKIAVVVLGNAQWPALRLYADRVVVAVNAAVAGSCMEVEIPTK